MAESGTVSITVTNLVLGAGVALCLLITAAGVIREIVAKRKERHG